MATTCARTDAKTQKRDIQIKFDIAKNEDGPLRKTMKTPAQLAKEKSDKAMTSSVPLGPKEPNLARHPGLTERFHNIEDHLAIKYGKLRLFLPPFVNVKWAILVPAPPHSLLERIKFIEEHIMKVEREHPPWAALHFKQPNRGVRANRLVTARF